MNITSINKNYLQYNNYQEKIKSVPLKGLRQSKIVSTRLKSDPEMFLRKLYNRVFDISANKKIKSFIDNLSKIKPEQNETYMNQIIAIARKFSCKKIIEVNDDIKIFKKIVENEESNIFIMNHSNQSEDPQMLAAFNLLLSDAYKDNNKKFLMPKIILNEDILKAMNPTLRQAYENIGAVGVDAKLLGRNSYTNAKALMPIIRDIIDNKINLFIFPEGRLASRKQLSFEERFQPGIASIVNIILNRKTRINIVPLAFAYGQKENKDVRCIQIGSPIELKRTSGITTISKTDTQRGITSSDYIDNKKILENEEDIILSRNGEAISPNKITPYLTQILCDNLDFNVNIAKHKVTLPYEDSEIREY